MSPTTPRPKPQRGAVMAQDAAHEAHPLDEALLRDLAASIPGAMFRFRHCTASGPLGLAEPHRLPAWTLIYISPGVEALFDISVAQACQDYRVLWACVLPEDRPSFDASLIEAVEAGVSWELEFRIALPSGQLRWVHVVAICKLDPEPGYTLWTGVMTDVSQRRRLEAVLQAQETSYRTLFETVPQGLVYHDAQGRITAANPAALRILRLSLDQLQGRSSMDPQWRAVREDGSPLPGDQHPAMQVLRTGQPVENVLMGVRVNDSAGGANPNLVWVLVSATPLFKDGQLSEVYASFEDITSHVQLTQKLKLQATTDHLTGVANRRCLMERLGLEFERVQRHPLMQCSVLALDLDLFKRVNDQWGHAAGDAVLTHVARLMQQTTRAVDVVGRSGGEEFIVLLPDTGAVQALELAERLRGRIETQAVQQGGRSLGITASMGVSVILPGDVNADAVLARADRALYEAKHAGRNAVRLG